MSRRETRCHTDAFRHRPLPLKDIMSKDCRIVVRMSEELRDWVHEQAQLGEQDDAAFVRMVLSNLRRGGVAAPTAALVVPAPVAMVRDVLNVSSAAQEVVEQPTFAEQSPQAAASAYAEATADRPSIDLDALVDGALDQAVAEGLTEPQIEATNGEPPPAGVRSLFRRPVPFSPGGNQLARIEQYLASN
jgi:hypothetical protein